MYKHILKKAASRTNPYQVALQIIKNAPKKHPRVNKYLKLLNRFGSNNWLSSTPIDRDTKNKALFELSKAEHSQTPTLSSAMRDYNTALHLLERTDNYNPQTKKLKGNKHKFTKQLGDRKNMAKYMKQKAKILEDKIKQEKETAETMLLLNKLRKKEKERLKMLSHSRAATPFLFIQKT